MRVTTSRTIGWLTAALMLAATLWAASPGGAVVPGTNGKIVFQRCTGTVTCQIYTANSNGTSLKRLTTSGLNQDPAWSPDGKRIAFAGNKSGRL